MMNQRKWSLTNRKIIQQYFPVLQASLFPFFNAQFCWFSLFNAFFHVYMRSSNFSTNCFHCKWIAYTKIRALETENDPTSFDMTKLVVTILILQESFEWSLGAEQIVWQQVAAFHFAEAFFFPHGISYA